MSNWELIVYDVWGNVNEGFEVNQAFTTGRVVTIVDDENDEQITDALISLGVVADDSMFDDFDFDGDEYVIYVNDDADGYPICELRRTDDEPTGGLLS